MLPPVYLLELFAPKNQVLLESNVFRCLNTAVQEAVHFCSAYTGDDAVASVDVSKNSEDIDGIAFFKSNGEMVACLSRFNLDNEPLAAGPYDFSVPAVELQGLLLDAVTAS